MKLVVNLVVKLVIHTAQSAESTEAEACSTHATPKLVVKLVVKLAVKLAEKLVIHTTQMGGVLDLRNASDRPD